jgi:uncharacterized protein (DUF1810 family)
MLDLERFVEAQRDQYAGYDAALREIAGGGKRGHWIWYVFPQLAGLGTSGMSRAYAIRDASEAEAYLRHPTLGPRLVAIAGAVRDALATGSSVERVMGSSIDATKLVSSMTLFEAVAAALPREPAASADRLLPIAGEILAAAERQGYARCALTERALGRDRG